VDAVLTRRPYIPLGITVFVAAIFAFIILSRARSMYKSNRKLYEHIRVGEEKLILDAIADSNKGSSRNLMTGEAIVDSHPALSSNVHTAHRFIDMFAQIRNIGLIKERIRSDYDEPVLVWKANFQTSGRRGKATRFGEMISE
jgi:hypothetical protein